MRIVIGRESLHVIWLLQHLNIVAILTQLRILASGSTKLVWMPSADDHELFQRFGIFRRIGPSNPTPKIVADEDKRLVTQDFHKGANVISEHAHLIALHRLWLR